MLAAIGGQGEKSGKDGRARIMGRREGEEE